MKKLRLVIVTIAAIMSLGATAQEDAHPRWSLSFYFVGSELVNPQHAPYQGNVVLNEDAGECIAPPMGLAVEYNFRSLPFALRGAAEAELASGDDYLSSDFLVNFSIGGRYRPAPSKWLLYPYAGIDLMYTNGEERGEERELFLSWIKATMLFQRLASNRC